MNRKTTRVEDSNVEAATAMVAPESAARNRLIVPAIILVVALIIAGLLLPPISLGQYFTSGEAAQPAAGVSPAEEAVELSEASRAIPGQIDIMLDDGARTINVAALSGGDFAAHPAAAALPEGLGVQGAVYRVDFEDAAPTGEVMLAAPGAVEQIDVYGWDGRAWRFLPSRLDESGAQLVVDQGVMLPMYALVQSTESPTAVYGGAVLTNQTLPDRVAPRLDEVIVGTLTLRDGDGALAGDISRLDVEADQWLRVTNTGAVVDQVSLGDLLNNDAAQVEHIDALVNAAADGGFQGLNLDYQGVVAGQRERFTGFVTALADALHNAGLRLAVTVATPVAAGDAWDTGGQDWAAIGQIVDVVFLQLPLDPSVYDDGAAAEAIVAHAVRRISRDRLSLVASASAIDAIGEVFRELPNSQALAQFGRLEMDTAASAIAPGETLALALSGGTSELAWSAEHVAYSFDYEARNQAHTVWLGNETVVLHRLRFVKPYNLRGAMINGLGDVTAAENYAAVYDFLRDGGAPPQPAAVAVVWVVEDEAGGVVASNTTNGLTYEWETPNAEGTYTVNVGVSEGDVVTELDSVDVVVAAPVEEVAEAAAEEESLQAASAVEEEAEEAEPEAEATEAPAAEAPLPASEGAVAVVNTGANIRQGPGVVYGTVAGGAEAGTRVTLIGRNSGSDWMNIILPNEDEGWIFAPLLNIDSDFSVASLPVVEVEAPPVAQAPSGGGAPSAPPPPISNTGFELGGQTHSLAHPAQMLYAGMHWVKFQHKWSVGDPPDVVAGRIQQAHANGFKVLLSIPGSDHSNIDYGAYVAFLGGVAALGPDAIEVWNEMNIDREWPSGQISPAAYVNNMLAPAYNAIKAANPSVMVISGAPAPTGFFGGCGGGGCDDQPYIAGMAAAGAANFMDCLGIHYNEGIVPPSQQSGDPRSEHYTRYFWGMTNAYFNAMGGARPLCYTELGYLSAEGYPPLGPGFSWASGTTIGQHAAWLAEATSLAASSGKVRMLIVFNIDIGHYTTEDPQAGFAIIRADGSCPACETLRQVTGGR